METTEVPQHITYKQGSDLVGIGRARDSRRSAYSQPAGQAKGERHAKDRGLLEADGQGWNLAPVLTTE